MNVAEEARQLMAELGVHRFEDLIGRSDLLDMDDAIDHWKAKKVDLSMVLRSPDVPADVARRRTRGPDPVLEDSLDWALVRRCSGALERGEPTKLGPIGLRNVNRTVGGILSGEIARRYGAEGLPDGTIEIALTGSAGQSFGAWLARGVTLALRGETNDYTGKGMSGGIIIVRPPEQALYRAEDNMIVGNTVLYGATAAASLLPAVSPANASRSGTLAPGRWSRASATTGCEYMTAAGGRRARPNRPQLRCRHERRHRVRLATSDHRFASRANTENWWTLRQSPMMMTMSFAA